MPYCLFAVNGQNAPHFISIFFYNIVAHWLLCSSKLFKKKYNEKKMKQLPPAWHWKQRRAYNPLNIKVAYIFYKLIFLEERIQISEPARSGNSKRLQVGNNAYRPTSKKGRCGGAWLIGFWYRNQRTNALVYWRFFSHKTVESIEIFDVGPRDPDANWKVSLAENEVNYFIRIVSHIVCCNGRNTNFISNWSNMETLKNLPD